MRSIIRILIIGVFGIVACAITSMKSWAMPVETVLHAFSFDADAGFPYAGLTSDSKGNLYGVAYLGGHADGVCCGAVFQLTPNGGGWNYAVIHTFTGPNFDGEAPFGGLTVDAAGNLYGTAQQGGKGTECGIVYELSPSGGGRWTEAILHQFNRSLKQPIKDGCTPSSRLVFDPDGNLYGTTVAGGGKTNGDIGCDNWGCGTVFKLARQPDGKWKETVIHRFPDGEDDGINPYSGVVFDGSGNLWGTTLLGTLSLGTAYELSQDANGKWKEVRHFDFTDDSTGWDPYGGLVADTAGNVFGTTLYGGNGPGVVFELTPGKQGQLSETMIHQFTTCNDIECPDGLLPFGGLSMDMEGNLYGTTQQGGAAGTFCNSPGTNVAVGCGILFKLTRKHGGRWGYKIAYAFPGGDQGSVLTDDRPLIDGTENFFGTTFVGGDVSNPQCPQEVAGQTGCGVVLKVAPGSSENHLTDSLPLNHSESRRRS